MLAVIRVIYPWRSPHLAAVGEQRGDAFLRAHGPRDDVDHVRNNGHILKTNTKPGSVPLTVWIIISHRSTQLRFVTFNRKYTLIKVFVIFFKLGLS